MSRIETVSPKKEYVHSFPALTGGLNLWELDYRLRSEESPAIENLMWREGALNCRDGQVWVNDAPLGTGYAAYERLFRGFIVAHIGEKLYSFDPEEGTATQLITGLSGIEGSFFLYGEKLYYKTRGSYTVIEYADGALSAEAVTGYVPVTVVNASPHTGAGDIYQPENRISAGKTVWYNAESGVSAYKLPAENIDSVDSVSVDGSELSADDYTVDLTTGTVTFASAPPVYDPPRNNTVCITYSKANQEATDSIMDCRSACVYGGTGSLCVVMGGSLAQPNAYFWNGNNIAMDASYFPMAQYQLAGGSHNAVTGFGRQQSYLIVFQERSVGRTSTQTAEIEGRTYIDMPYTAINSEVGCDLPGSIRLVENNLVWATKKGGVYILTDASSAYEMDVRCISRKINGSSARPGLLEDLSFGAAAAVDDGQRYLLCANSHVWAWDYGLSGVSDPSWFLWTDIGAAAFVREGDSIWHINGAGQLSRFIRAFADYSNPIRKLYRFAPQHFGSYERLKNVNTVLISSRSDTNSVTALRYITDRESRKDSTPLKTMNWLLWPRNLEYRSLKGRGFAEVFRRRPLCRRVRHFTMELENNELGQDLSVVSAQIFYNYQGRQR